MKTATKPPSTIDHYIAAFPPAVQAILEKIRLTIRKAAPGAEEAISYRMPSFRSNGVLVYFAAFKAHIGLYPMVGAVREKFEKKLSAYDGAKGTVRFPLDRPIPYGLIGRIVKFKVKENRERAEAKRKKK